MAVGEVSGIRTALRDRDLSLPGERARERPERSSTLKDMVQERMADGGSGGGKEQSKGTYLRYRETWRAERRRNGRV